MLASLTTRPRQHTCAHDENQLLKLQIKLCFHKSGISRTTGLLTQFGY